MKPIRSITTATVTWVALCLLMPAPKALAILGAADTTIIVGDATDLWKWPRELAQWTTMIQNAEQQIARTDELIRIVGDPERLVHELVGSVPDLMKPIDDAIGLETREEALKFSKQLYSIGSVAIKTYNDANKIGPSYEAYGEKVKRDPKRYAYLQMQEAMYARYKKAVSNAEAVAKHEMEVQREALRKLAANHTETETAVVNAVIAASKQRQDIAQQKADQAKAELDAFRGQMAVEAAWKTEADKEWAEAVITQMREKALAAYQRQVGAGTGSGTE